ncbi:MAG: type II toxin-antitoxin system Phd/YefM family antitoxin [Elusimicrobia bacterium]|nr:type II toxin-antitoxin system Phd/YefM family antitoxin [Elusimicrobiota bacterium]
MSLERDIKSVTQLKNRTAEVLAQLNATRRPVIITQDGRPRAVMQDPESYERLRAAVGLLKLLAQGEADAANGRMSGQDKVFRDIASRLKSRRPDA